MKRKKKKAVQTGLLKLQLKRVKKYKGRPDAALKVWAAALMR